MKDKDFTCIFTALQKSLNVDLIVHSTGTVAVVVTDNESGEKKKLKINVGDTDYDDAVWKIGEEIMSWVCLMFEEIQNETSI